MRYTTFSSPRPYKGISYAIEENNAASIMCYIDSFDFFQEHYGHLRYDLELPITSEVFWIQDCEYSKTCLHPQLRT